MGVGKAEFFQHAPGACVGGVHICEERCVRVVGVEPLEPGVADLDGETLSPTRSG